MKKTKGIWNNFLIIIILFFLVSIQSPAQNIVKDTLQNQITTLHTEINSLKDSIINHNVQIETANKILNTSNNIVEYSGWIGIFVTVLIFGFGLFGYLSFSSSRKEIKELILDANKRLNEAENKFNDFINSPERINALLEELSFRQIEKEIDDTNEKVFLQGLYRANTLSKDKRIIVARRIRSKLYDPNFSLQFYAIYTFLQQYSDFEMDDIALEYYSHKNLSIDSTALYMISNDIFKKEPYQITPFDFYYGLNEETRSLAFSHLQRLLSDKLFYQFLEEIIKNEDTMKSFSNYGRIDKEVFTKIVSDNINSINAEKFKELLPTLAFDEKIFRRAFQMVGDIKKLDFYLMNSLNKIENFELLIEMCDLNKPQIWIDLLSLYLSDIPQDRIKSVLHKYFLQDNFPQEPFFSDELPLLFEKNYGIRKQGDDYYYKNQKLGIGQSVGFLGGPLYDVVNHPILKIDIRTSSIN